MSRRLRIGAALLWAAVVVMYAWAIISHRQQFQPLPSLRAMPRPFAVGAEDFKP